MKSSFSPGALNLCASGQAGIPVVDIIDFDYPYWHTAADTPDKVSANSLKIVGETLLAWLATQR